MVWRDSFPPANELTLDAEAERERRLAAQARAGAEWALTALVARYQPAVTRYLTRLCGDQGRARVLAERVFQRMERRLHGPHGGENLRLWLLRASTEAGLDAIRRPRRAPAPRLDATRIAGLLPARASEASAQAEQVIRGSIKGIKRVVGAVSRQARPLVWQSPAEAPHGSAPGGGGRGQQERRGPGDIEPGPVDEALGGLDPREALRLRLVRLTLADLPYGDAQCLALHLVAGLNQAEVARSLGITNSAARKRIVQGLAQFSTRYGASVRSLGLPDELGYGDALPRQRVEDLPIFAPPEPPPAPPIVVSERPEETSPEPAYDPPYLAPTAPTTIPLQVESFGPLSEQGVSTSGVAFYATSSPDIPAFAPPEDFSGGGLEEASPEEFYTLDNQRAETHGPEEFYTLEGPTLESQQAFASSYNNAFSEPYAGPYAEPSGAVEMPPFADDSYQPYEPYASLDSSPGAGGEMDHPYDEPDETLSALQDDQFDSAHDTGETATPGMVTRVAADAIVGPVVDALPVDNAPYSPPGYGSPNARSMPLTYELLAGATEAAGITMNWIEPDGGMAPLSFEAVAVPDAAPDPVGVAPGGLDDPWAASAVLDLEPHITPDERRAQAAAGRLDVSLDVEREDGATVTPDLNIESSADDYVWERAQQLDPPEQGMATPALERGAMFAAAIDNPAAHEGTSSPVVSRPPDGTPAQRPLSRTLEDLWDETPDHLVQ